MLKLDFLAVAQRPAQFQLAVAILIETELALFLISPPKIGTMATCGVRKPSGSFREVIEKLGLSTKSKDKALGQSISLNLVYTPPHTPPPHKLLGHFRGT